MKLVIKIVVLVAIAVGMVACCGFECKNEENADATVVSAQETQSVDYAVEGMVCAMGCAATIQKEVADIDGVIVADVNYEDEKAHFEFDPTKTSEAAIKTKIASIADGQYKLSTWVEKAITEEEELEEEEADEIKVQDDEDLIKVSLPSFEIPNLFTLLLNQL